MRYVLSAALAMLSLCGCLTKRTTIDTKKGTKKEEFIIRRPVKDFVEKIGNE